MTDTSPDAVERLDPYVDRPGIAHMCVVEVGDFVRYSDFAALAARLKEAEAERDALVRAVNAERDALAAYDQTPSDRGGQRGPKGTAYRRWLDARANVAAALAKQESKE